MKMYVYLPLFILINLFSGCDVDDSPSGQYPHLAHLYFDFVDRSGLSLRETEIEVAGAILDNELGLIPVRGTVEFEWETMQTFVLTEGDTLSGPLIVGGGLTEKTEHDEQPLGERYSYYHYLIRLNGTYIDTLLVEKRYNDFGNNNFEVDGIAIFLNDILTTSWNWLPNNKVDGERLIYFFENKEVVSSNPHSFPWVLKIYKNLGECGN